MVIKSLDESKDFFLHTFPTPRFLTMPAVGLNLSDHSIKILELIPNGPNFKLGRYGDEKIPDGVINNGTINDKKALKEVLFALKRKYSLKFVSVSLPEEKAYVFRTEIEKSEDKKEIRNKIEFQLEENVPISSNEAIFDYKIIPNESDDGKLKVSVSVLPQKVVASYVSLFHEVGLVPVSFEIEAESIARAVIKSGDMGTYMIVDYGRTRTGFSVISHGVIRYTSTINIGGESLVEAIQKHSNVSREEAEEIKMEKGLNRGNKKLSIALSNIIADLEEEINKQYVYWHTHKDNEGQVGEKIQKIILSGGNSNFPGLDEHLAAKMKIKVEKANVWANVFSLDKVTPSIKLGDSLSYASAVGLALHSFNIS